MSDTVKKLLERRTNLVNQMREVAERAIEENRDMSGEEVRQFTEFNAEVDALQERADAILAGEKRAKEIEQSFADLAGRPVEGRAPGQDKQAEEIRQFLTGRGGREYRISPASPTEWRDLVKGTNSAGGYTVPQSFFAQLVQHMVDVNSLLGLGNVINTSGGETLPVPKTTSHGGAALVSEATALAESDPAFGVINLGAYKLGQLIQISRELLDDSGVDILGYLAESAGRNLGLALAPYLATGTGSSQPRGVVTDATLGVTGATGLTGGFGTQSTAGQGGDYLIDLYHSTIAPYRSSPSCAFVMRDATGAAIRKLKSSTGDYVWQPSLVVGDPDTILGKPVYFAPDIAAIGLSAKSVLFGDFSKFFIRIAGPIRFERSDEFAFSSDLTTFRAVMRVDSALIDLTGSIKYFQGGAS